MWLISIALLVELLAAIAGSLFIRKCKPSAATRYLVYFLWLTVAVEYTSGIARYCIMEFESLYGLKDSLLINNVWLYNIYGLISGLFYIWYFRYHLITKKAKYLLTLSMIMFAVAYCISLVVTHSFFTKIQIYPELSLSVFILFAIARYFIEKIQDNTISSPMNLELFVISGILIFRLLIIQLHLMVVANIAMDLVTTWRLLLVIACVLLYGLITTGFLLGIRQRSKKYMLFSRSL